MPNVAVVLVNYHTIWRVIDIASKYSSFSIISEIVIVNNDTTDEERKILSELRNPKIDIIFSSENLGYSKGNNLGVVHLMNYATKPDYIIISNSDINIDELTIQKIIKEMERFPNFAAMAPRQIDNNGNIIPLRFIDLGYKRLFLLCFVFGLDKKTEKYIKKYNDNIFIQSFLHGSFFICRTQAFIDCGMFDPNVFLYREEEILGKKINNLGYKIGVVGNLYYRHNHEYLEEALHIMIRHKKMEFSSERYFFRKYLGASKLKMIYVHIFQKLLLCRIILSYIVKKTYRFIFL